MLSPFSMVGNMRKLIVFFIFLLPSVAFSATWSVASNQFSTYPRLKNVVNIEQSSFSSELFAAFNVLPPLINGETYTNSGCVFTVGSLDTMGTCTVTGTSASTRTIRINILKDAAICPPTVELKSKTAPIIQSADKAYVSWSVSQVTPEKLCHNSCIYYASSATVSTCYRTSAGSTDGFCNFVVAVNTSAGTCTVSSGYAAASAGAELNPTPDPGDGGGGTDPDPDPNPNPGGGTGGGTGGSTVVTGTVGIEFKSPGTLSSQLGHYLDKDGSVETAATQLPKDMSKQYQDSDIGKKVDGAIGSFTELANAAPICPTGQFELFERTIVLDAHCRLFAEIEPVLKLASYAAWMLVAVLIIFSA